MNRVAIAFSTCDRVELSRQSIEPLLKHPFDLFWFDGSKTDEGKQLPFKYGIPPAGFLHTNVTGGSGAAIICALTTMLVHPNQYDMVGLCENDVLLQGNWFANTMLLFSRGEEDGLEVGAVTARCYEDRILSQRDGYAVLHNAGAGFIIFTREAAELILRHYRVQWTTENRQTFAQLTSTDIGKYWAFRGAEHFLVADWRWDSVLASHGLASLALTPSPVQMIGQIPSLEDQGLTLAGEPAANIAAHGSDPAYEDEVFKRYRDNLARIRQGDLKLPNRLFHRDTAGGVTIFPHQLAAIGGSYQGSWKLKDAPGFGPFGWIADSHQEDFNPRIFVPAFGPCEILVGGGKDGGQVHVVDEQSGFDSRPVLPPEGPQGQIVAVNIPGNITYRTIRVNMSTPGCCFYGVRCREEQPVLPGFKFDWNTLPHGRAEL